MYDARDVWAPGQWDAPGGLSYDDDDGRTVHLCHDCRELLGSVADALRSRDRTTPAEPDWQRALRWLDDRCGSREAVLRLDAEPLTAQLELPSEVAGQEGDLARSVGVLLDGIADRFFDAEVGVALRNGLALYIGRGGAMALRTQPAERVALGVVWVVGKANGLLGATGVATEKAIKEHLGTTGSGSSVGQRIRSAFRSAYDWTPGGNPWSWRDDLEAVGEPLILTAGTRARLIEVRDRALRLQEDAQRDEPGRDGSA